MLHDDGLIVSYILNGQGGGDIVDWDGIRAWQPAQGPLWVHLDFTQPASQEWLTQHSALDPFIIRALLAEESRPRAVIYQDGFFVSLRGVNLNPGQDPEDMVSIRVWVDKHRVISTRRRHLLSVDDMRDALNAKKGAKSPGEFIAQLNECLANRMADVFDSLDERVDAFDASVIDSDDRQILSEISTLRRELIEIRRYLAPQREALTRLCVEDNAFIAKTQRVHLRETADRVIRYLEDLDSARDRAAVTQEQLNNQISSKIDQRMYILSVVAVIFLPLTFVTGLLGINVGGIPLATNKLGFTVVTGALLVVGVALFWVFRRKKWM